MISVKIKTRTELKDGDIKPEAFVGLPLKYKGKTVGKCVAAQYTNGEGFAEMEYEISDKEIMKELTTGNKGGKSIEFDNISLPMQIPELSTASKPFKQARIKIVLSLVYDFMQVPYVKSLMNLKKPGYTNLDISRGPQILAMNNSMSDFEDYDAILLTEWDHDFEPDALEKLWNMNVPVASALFKSRNGDHNWLLIDESGEENMYVSPVSMTDPFRIDCTGLGFMLIRKEVLAKIGRPIFKPFLELHNNIDRQLCRDIKTAGFDVMINPQVRLGHYGTERIF